MEPGNWIYIPRGVYHNAITLDEHSLHITISVNTHTWADIFKHIFTEIQDFCQPLPKGILDKANQDNSKEEYKKRIEKLSKYLDNKKILDQLFEKQFSDMDILPDNGFMGINNLNNIKLDTTVSLRRGIILDLQKKDEINKLFCSGLSSYSLDHDSETIINFIINKETFKISDLPGSISAENKIKLVQRFILDGVVVRCQF